MVINLVCGHWQIYYTTVPVSHVSIWVIVYIKWEQVAHTMYVLTSSLLLVGFEVITGQFHLILLSIRVYFMGRMVLLLNPHLNFENQMKW